MREPAGTRLPVIFDDLDVGINLHDPTTNEILDANARLEELYGYSADVLRTMGVGDYTAPSTKFSQDEANRLIQRAADGEPQTFHWQIERSTGGSGGSASTSVRPASTGIGASSPRCKT